MKNSFILFTAYTILKIIFYLNLQVRFIPELVFFDVGQGDSIFITTPEKKTILVDGGSGYTVSQHLNTYFPLNNCSIDAVFLTHPHADHLEGLNRILYHCKVKKIFYTPVLYESGLFAEWEELVSQMDATVRKASFEKDFVFRPFLSGDVYIPDKSGKIKFYGIWPPEEYVGKTLSNVNNVSTVMFFDAGNFEALLTGDAEVEVLREIEKEDFPFLTGALEVYKLSHHGAKNGFSSSFWQKLSPLLSIISVGKENKFGHPHSDVISWLVERKTSFLRTDMEGTIKIRYNSL